MTEPRCPRCADALVFVHEYAPEIVPNGQPLPVAASYVYRCPNDGLWRVFGGGKIVRYALPFITRRVCCTDARQQTAR